MSNKTFQHIIFEFDNGQSIEVVHNINNVGSSIGTVEAAVQNWLLRTDEITSQSFCDYVNSKGIHEAYTVEEYERLTGKSIK